jgi:hypothetical protein
MRGQQSLYNDFFGYNPAETTNQQHPRNFYNPARNEMIVYRYYFWSEIKFYRYEKCLEELEQDIYLMQPTLINIISENNKLLADVMKAKPSLKELSKKYPRLNWNL